MRERSALTLFAAALLAACGGAGNSARAAELQPAFPNYALELPPLPLTPNPSPQGGEGGAAAARDNPVGPPEIGPPFSWTQIAVVREGELNFHVLHGFDPDLQPLEFELVTGSFEFVEVRAFDARTGLITGRVERQTASNLDTLQFNVTARGVTSAQAYDFIYDIRARNARIRLTPVVTRSPGTFIRPGQTVRYTWTETGVGEKRPKCEAVLEGRTGPALGSSASLLTSVPGVKVQPAVLGAYLLTVTPRDVRGEPPRGSTSNGLVFQCAFGSDNLPPVTDGLAADNFTPDVNQSVTVAPVATDPETGQTVFDNEVFDFGDGTVVPGVNGPASHAYAAPGIYRVRCTVADAAGLTATAEDSLIVGATLLPKLPFVFKKNIPLEEAGTGVEHEDRLAVTFKGAQAQPGDRIIFMYNRNQFGRLSGSDAADDVDIILGAGGGFYGSTRNADLLQVFTAGGNLKLVIENAQFDRTGDPRFNRSELRGIFRHQRIALCVVPQTGAPRVLAFVGNMFARVKGGASGGLPVFVPEDSISGQATAREPNPKRQEDF